MLALQGPVQAQDPQFFMKDAAGNYVPYIKGTKPTPDTVYILLPTGDYYPVGPPPELPEIQEFEPQQPMLPEPITIRIPEGNVANVNPFSYTNAVQEDRELIENIVSTAQAFEADIAARLEALDGRLLGNYGAYNALLERTMAAEGVVPKIRDLNHLWTGEGLKTLREVAQQFEPVRAYYPPVTPGTVKPKGPCSGEWRLIYPESTNGIEGCYSHKPTVYEYQNFETVEPIKALLHTTSDVGQHSSQSPHHYSLLPADYRQGWFIDPQGYSTVGGAYGALPGHIEELRYFYDMQLRIVEELIGYMGAPFKSDFGNPTGGLTYPASDLIRGLRYKTDASYEWQHAYPATGSASEGWTLAPQMRELLIEMQSRVEEGHRIWAKYEEILSAEYPEIVAKAHLRQIANWQRYVRLQEPIYDEIMNLYNTIDEDEMKARFGNSIPDQTGPKIAAAFNEEHKALFEPLDQPWDCGWSLHRSLDNLTMDFTDPIFDNPFPVVDEDVPVNGVEDIVFKAYRMPKPASSLFDMPEFGGVRLTECAVEKATDTLEMAKADETAGTENKRYSAKDTALP